MSNVSRRPNKEQRTALAQQTLALTARIINTTNATNEADLYSTLLPRITPDPNGTRPRVTVQNSDSFTTARLILETNPTAKIGVLNMASERHPGGGWLRGALAQEEALCFRSTLAVTLHKKFYPLPMFGTIWSPNVTVFKDEVDTWFWVYQPAEMFTVGVVSLAALRRPLLTPDKRNYGMLIAFQAFRWNTNYFKARPQDLRTVKDKIRQVFRVLAVNGTTHCVMGAMGCGAFQNPPVVVAQCFKDVLEEGEFNGAFEEIIFAVLDSRAEGNFEIFRDALQAS
ncbi:hypothetical protein N7509_006725 [Penicillium cosmopolitanum]|uniref:Microbial-type PARG catalytic domain-containing protein n=1 Tax=Penicillium cosmopolitanum TaxID=1131564 RepID=A0A9X0B7L9_9EURO|nr:uncharacterized protein N7509_006725 [Penicillium cosmopolitanum]KAJ5391235.1 hypothetical protein N7509_006725 [Penicillium cosmopolitanum]